MSAAAQKSEESFSNWLGILKNTLGEFLLDEQSEAFKAVDAFFHHSVYSKMCISLFTGRKALFLERLTSLHRFL